MSEQIKTIVILDRETHKTVASMGSPDGVSHQKALQVATELGQVAHDALTYSDPARNVPAGETHYIGAVLITDCYDLVPVNLYMSPYEEATVKVES